MTATEQNIEENEIDVDDYETKVKMFLCMMIVWILCFGLKAIRSLFNV